MPGYSENTLSFCQSNGGNVLSALSFDFASPLSSEFECLCVCFVGYLDSSAVISYSYPFSFEIHSYPNVFVSSHQFV